MTPSPRALVSHHQLTSRHIFTGRLELQTALRISSGRADDRTDAPLIRTLDGVPYIPGSSLRGVLRAEVERLLAGVGEAVSRLCSCTLFAKSTPSEAGNDCAEIIQEKLQLWEKTPPEEQAEEERGKTRDDKIWELATTNLCDVCRLFGSRWYASRLIIVDALPDENQIYQLQGRARLRDGVGIDRDTGAARENVKFDYEVLEPGGGCPTLLFEMIAENLDATDIRLVNLVLKILKVGLYVGGKRAGGLGLLRLQEQKQTENGQVRKFHYQVKCLADPATWWPALTTGEDLATVLYQDCHTWEEAL